jgi:serine/threonine-protein kinase
VTEDRWKRLKSLYAAAQQTPVDERAAFLTQACEGDERLQREVESLLAHNEKADVEAFLDNPQETTGSLTGANIAHYRVGERIGAGGMGEVYRAKDQKLGRDVALKVLPPSLVGDPERRNRFAREARVLAALNHVNIAAIYGLEEAGDSCALALELVEGPTLADRLEKGAMPVHEALQVARQLAYALEAAHGEGIIHRDLKPANIKINPKGLVKVLDFGLAKSLVTETRPENLSKLATVTGTARGVILGTPAYMSPEQAAGQSDALDARVDTWAFGCVLFEMLSGRRPFAGDSVTELLGAILAREPDWDALPDTIPEKLVGLMRRCLTKDLKQRLHRIADARIELDELASLPSTDAAWTRTARTRRAPIVRLIVASAATLLLAAFCVNMYWNRGLRMLEVISQEPLTHKPPEDPILHAAISPNGRYVVYNDNTAIHIHDIDTGELKSISGATPDMPKDFCFM